MFLLISFSIGTFVTNDIKDTDQKIVPIETPDGTIIAFINDDANDSKVIDKYNNSVIRNVNYPIKQTIIISRYIEKIIVVPVAHNKFIKSIAENTDLDVVIAHNDKHRRYNATEDLYTLDDLKGIQFSPIVDQLEMPIICASTESKTNYAHEYVFPTQDICGDRIVMKSEWWSTVLTININHHRLNICIAGGAASNAIYDSDPGNKFAHDIDIFFVRCSVDEPANESAEETAKKDRSEICSILKAFVTDQRNYIMSIRFIKGIVNINWGFDKSIVNQFILRVYPSISALLHSFDIGSCCVAFDGLKTYMTAFGIYSIVNKLNIVVPKYASNSYTNRLFKYAMRGYAIACHNIPSWKPSRYDIKLTLNHNTFNVSQPNKSSRLKFIAVDWTNTFNEDCDYSLAVFDENLFVWRTDDTGQTAERYINLVNLDALSHNHSYSALITSMNCSQYANFIDQMFDFPCPEEFTVFDDMCISLREYTDVDRSGRIHLKAIQYYYNMSDQETADFMYKYCINGQLGLESALTEKRTMLHKKWLAECETPIDFVLHFDPSVQVAANIFSSTLNPTPMSYKKFYE